MHVIFSRVFYFLCVPPRGATYFHPPPALSAIGCSPSVCPSASFEFVSSVLDTYPRAHSTLCSYPSAVPVAWASSWRTGVRRQVVGEYRSPSYYFLQCLKRPTIVSEVLLCRPGHSQSHLAVQTVDRRALCLTCGASRNACPSKVL